MKLLTVEQAADALAVHPNTVRGMLERLGAVDLARGGKRRMIRIPETSLDRYIRECEIVHPERAPRRKQEPRIARRR